MEAIETAVDHASDLAGMANPLMVDYPSVRLSREAAPDMDDGDVWKENRERILGEADAMIICDVGDHAAGFGAAMELDLMSLQAGPILYLEAEGCGPHSRYLRARSDELDLSFLAYRDLDHARELARDWIADRSSSIEEAARLRADRQYAGEFLAQRLNRRWDQLPEDKRMQVLGALHLTPPRIKAALRSPALLEPLLGSRLETLCALLGIDHVSDDDIPLDASGPSMAALIDAAVDQRWDGAATEELWRGALSEISAADPSLARDGLRTKSAWIDRAQER